MSVAMFYGALCAIFIGVLIVSLILYHLYRYRISRMEVLRQLSLHPMTAVAMRKTSYGRLRTGTMYVVLARMEEDGLIRAITQSDGAMRVYYVTAAGRAFYTRQREREES